MRLQAGSLARPKGSARTILCFACALATCTWCPAFQDPATPSRPEPNRIRFQVVDSTDSRAIPGAAVILVLWRTKESGAEKTELEGKTDESGFVEFSLVDARRFAITVTTKGYRSYWRWVRGPERLKRLSVIKLEPWISAHK